MTKLKKIFAVFMIFMTPSICFSQPNIMPEEVRKIQDKFSKERQQVQEAQLKRLEASNPKLAEMQRRHFSITEQIKTILISFNEGKISEAKAAEALKPFLKEQIAIEKNEDYQIENRLNSFFSRVKGFE